jgi:hypothetical protein
LRGFLPDQVIPEAFHTFLADGGDLHSRGEKVPPHWRLKGNFYLELVKFWGSVGLSRLGIEHRPPPTEG